MAKPCLSPASFQGTQRRVDLSCAPVDVAVPAEAPAAAAAAAAAVGPLQTERDAVVRVAAYCWLQDLVARMEGFARNQHEYLALAWACQNLAA